MLVGRYPGPVDADPLRPDSQTSPLLRDSDGDGLGDGDEDLRLDGDFDAFGQESDPTDPSSPSDAPSPDAGDIVIIDETPPGPPSGCTCGAGAPSLATPSALVLALVWRRRRRRAQRMSA